MKFIFNFIFYGVIYFLIYRYLPETFDTLVAWGNSAVDNGHDLLVWAVEKVSSLPKNGG